MTAEARWIADLREQVAARLKEHGVTQVALADHLGITAKHMNQILHGIVVGANPLLLERMAAAVGLRIAVADSGEPVPPLRQLRQHRRQVKALADLAAADHGDLAFVLADLDEEARWRLRAIFGGEGDPY